MPRSEPRPSARALALKLALVLALALAACFATRGPSPARILVRNSSGADVRLVVLQEVPQAGATSVRMGSVAPALRGATQVIDRPAGAPPLPAEVELRWTLASGEQRSQRLSLAELAGPADGRGLVFELLPDGTARVSIASP